MRDKDKSQLSKEGSMREYMTSRVHIATVKDFVIEGGGLQDWSGSRRHLKTQETRWVGPKTKE